MRSLLSQVHSDAKARSERFQGSHSQLSEGSTSIPNNWSLAQIQTTHTVSDHANLLMLMLSSLL